MSDFSLSLSGYSGGGYSGSFVGTSTPSFSYSPSLSLSSSFSPSFQPNVSAFNPTLNLASTAFSGSSPSYGGLSLGSSGYGVSSGLGATNFLSNSLSSSVFESPSGAGKYIYGDLFSGADADVSGGTLLTESPYSALDPILEGVRVGVVTDNLFSLDETQIRGATSAAVALSFDDIFTGQENIIRTKYPGLPESVSFRDRTTWNSPEALAFNEGDSAKLRPSGQLGLFQNEAQALNTDRNLFISSVTDLVLDPANRSIAESSITATDSGTFSFDQDKFFGSYFERERGKLSSEFLQANPVQSQTLGLQLKSAQRDYNLFSNSGDVSAFNSSMAQLQSFDGAVNTAISGAILTKYKLNDVAGNNELTRDLYGPKTTTNLKSAIGAFEANGLEGTREHGILTNALGVSETFDTSGKMIKSALRDFTTYVNDSRPSVDAIQEPGTNVFSDLRGLDSENMRVSREFSEGLKTLEARFDAGEFDSMPDYQTAIDQLKTDYQRTIDANTHTFLNEVTDPGFFAPVKRNGKTAWDRVNWTNIFGAAALLATIYESTYGRKKALEDQLELTKELERFRTDEALRLYGGRAQIQQQYAGGGGGGDGGGPAPAGSSVVASMAGGF